MKTALILTTINVPRVLSFYRALDPDVRFFVACDEKTPGEAYDFCSSISNCAFYSPDKQKDLGWECSSLMGWNTIARRNVALLEALKWGADVIISVDDDNIPIGFPYSPWFISKLFPTAPFVGVKVVCDVTRLERLGEPGWFDPGSLQFPVAGPPVCQRGFPPGVKNYRRFFEPVVGARIGVAQGMVLGDPDTSAVDRISRRPEVHQVSELLRSGLVTDPRETWAPLNSQNIAFTCQLSPCFLMVPQFDRYMDICAGLVAQRVMRELGLYVHFGQPFVWQQRNNHDLLDDLRAEKWGMENIEAFAEHLNSAIADFSDRKRDVLGMLIAIWAVVDGFKPMPEGVAMLNEAWIRDCAKAMG